MKAAVFEGAGSVAIKDVKAPLLDNGDILLKVSAVGVCPTDVKAYFNGSSSIKVPRILGHEVSGTIHDTQSSHFALGERVNVAADNPCMKCDRCQRGLHNLCRNITSLGVNIDGGYAEYMRVPKEFIGNGMVNRVSDSVSDLEATFMEPVAVSLNALSLINPKKSDSAVVIGDGPNAMIHLQLLKRVYSVKRVTVTGMVKGRLQLSKKLGADMAIDVVSEPEEIKALGNDTDIVDITIGNSKAMEQAMLLADSGTRIVIFGGSVNDTQIPISMNDAHYRQLTITGSTGTSLPHYAEAAKIVNSGLLDLKDLISETFPLENIRGAFTYSKELKGIKGAIVFS